MAATDRSRVPATRSASRRGANRGFSMIEVLVSLIIIQVGLLGLVGTQVVAQRAEAESYQRAQALILLDDMVERINANRYSASCFAFTDPTLGTPYLGVNDAGHYTPVCNVGNNTIIVTQSMNHWDSALQGAAEVGTINGTSAKIGAITSARGCVSSTVNTSVTPNITVYTIAVVWQGQTDGFVPTSFPNVPSGAANCGINLYGAETQRRLVWTTLEIANLQ